MFGAVVGPFTTVFAFAKGDCMYATAPTVTTPTATARPAIHARYLWFTSCLRVRDAGWLVCGHQARENSADEHDPGRRGHQDGRQGRGPDLLADQLVPDESGRH